MLQTLQPTDVVRRVFLEQVKAPAIVSTPEVLPLAVSRRLEPFGCDQRVFPQSTDAGAVTGGICATAPDMPGHKEPRTQLETIF
jgi:hypothetical protein